MTLSWRPDSTSGEYGTKEVTVKIKPHGPKNPSATFIQVPTLEKEPKQRVILTVMWLNQTQSYEICVALIEEGNTCRVSGFAVQGNHLGNYDTLHYIVCLNQVWEMSQIISQEEWKVRVCFHWTRMLSDTQVLRQSEHHSREVWRVAVSACQLISDKTPVKFHKPGPLCYGLYAYQRGYFEDGTRPRFTNTSKTWHSKGIERHRQLSSEVGQASGQPNTPQQIPGGPMKQDDVAVILEANDRQAQQILLLQQRAQQ